MVSVLEDVELDISGAIFVVDVITKPVAALVGCIITMLLVVSCVASVVSGVGEVVGDG